MSQVFNHKPNFIVDEYSLSRGAEFRDPKDFQDLIENASVAKTAIERLIELRRLKATEPQAAEVETQKLA